VFVCNTFGVGSFQGIALIENKACKQTKKHWSLSLKKIKGETQYIKQQHLKIEILQWYFRVSWLSRRFLMELLFLIRKKLFPVPEEHGTETQPAICSILI
jgi:hypothetical protein